MFSIFFSNTISNPRTVMIISSDTNIARFAVFTTNWLLYFTNSTILLLNIKHWLIFSLFFIIIFISVIILICNLLFYLFHWIFIYFILIQTFNIFLLYSIKLQGIINFKYLPSLPNFFFTDHCTWYRSSLVFYVKFLL